jgi:hypothetical protein
MRALAKLALSLIRSRSSFRYWNSVARASRLFRGFLR